jgi:hypothetical protein
MIPYFKEHVLHNEKKGSGNDEDNNEFKISLCKTIDKCSEE